MIHDSVSDEFRPFVPAGYAVLDTARGLLNGDEFEDVLLVLEPTEAMNQNRGDQLARPLLLLIGQPDGSLILAKRNDETVMCKSCGGSMGDPYQRMVIKNHCFSIEHYGGGGSSRFEHIITYRFDAAENNWLLEQDGSIYYAMNEDTSDDAEAVVKTGTEILTANDFGRVFFEEYRPFEIK